jgi:hypothetical protein
LSARWGYAQLTLDLGVDALNFIFELIVKDENVSLADLHAFRLSKFKVKNLIILLNAEVAQAKPVLELTAGRVGSLKFWGDALLVGLRIAAIFLLKGDW